MYSPTLENEFPMKLHREFFPLFFKEILNCPCQVRPTPASMGKKMIIPAYLPQGFEKLS